MGPNHIDDLIFELEEIRCRLATGDHSLGLGSIRGDLIQRMSDLAKSCKLKMPPIHANAG